MLKAGLDGVVLPPGHQWSPCKKKSERSQPKMGIRLLGPEG